MCLAQVFLLECRYGHGPDRPGVTATDEIDSETRSADGGRDAPCR